MGIASGGTPDVPLADEIGTAVRLTLSSVDDHGACFVEKGFYFQMTRKMWSECGRPEKISILVIA